MSEEEKKPVEEQKVPDPYKPNPIGRRRSQKGLDPKEIEEL